MLRIVIESDLFLIVYYFLLVRFKMPEKAVALTLRFRNLVGPSGFLLLDRVHFVVLRQSISIEPMFELKLR